MSARTRSRESEGKTAATLTSDGGVEPVEVGERERHRAEVHDDFTGAAARHEDAGVAAAHVLAAGVVHGEIDGGVERALDRPLDARVQQLAVAQLLNLPREDVVRLAHLAQERRVVPDRRRQVCPTLQQLPGR